MKNDVIDLIITILMLLAFPMNGMLTIIGLANFGKWSVGGNQMLTSLFILVTPLISSIVIIIMYQRQKRIETIYLIGD